MHKQKYLKEKMVSKKTLSQNLKEMNQKIIEYVALNYYQKKKTKKIQLDASAILSGMGYLIRQNEIRLISLLQKYIKCEKVRIFF